MGKRKSFLKMVEDVNKKKLKELENKELLVMAEELVQELKEVKGEQKISFLETGASLFLLWAMKEKYEKKGG